MSSRQSLVDAIHQLQASGIGLDDLWQAVENKRVEITAQRIETFGFEVSHHHRADFPRWPDDGGIYLDAHRVDHPTGFIDVAELRDLKNGLTRIERPPYWLVKRSGDRFEIYSQNKVKSGGDGKANLSASFVRAALVLDNRSCIDDDFNALTRTVAYEVTVLSREIRDLLGIRPPMSRERPGPKENYACEICDSNFLRWTRGNPSFDYSDKLIKFREIYAEHGHRLLQDGQQQRREKAALERLGFISPTKERRQNRIRN